ncbi:hypothetical protein [Paenibacillus sp. MMS18-CY102]|uniref:hypothetical protein n=1 Tax=Paenibacillus sp. MMS18-CY102 TaxID=2682849 RepID=UPI001365DB1A|nr:hypothetical protein [Paenibacillus sp. MMS18-CY102]MWC30942.1 hypothetical protein [Paenibacillus sp. MMS18-CY102]
MSTMDTIQQANAQIAALNALVAQLRAICPADSNDVVAVPQDIQVQVQAAGITIDTTQDITGNIIKLWIEQLNNQIDSLNSSQQLNMIKLQSEMNKQNEAYELLSNQMKQMQNATQSIINNMR